jgi:hypothetical protein
MKHKTQVDDSRVAVHLRRKDEGTLHRLFCTELIFLYARTEVANRLYTYQSVLLIL